MTVETSRSPLSTRHWKSSISTPDRRRIIEITERLKRNPYIPAHHVAGLSPKQLAFLVRDEEEAFYGGAAGGGKSDALLMAGLQYVDYSGYAAIIFRKTYADLSLPGALMDRAREWLGGTDAQWKEQEKTWRFPSGATLTFGYVDNDSDVYRYQSSEFQYVGWDELTQLKEFAYRYLFSRLRRLEGSHIPLRVRAASNPGGVGHDWVKQRFIVEGRSKGRIFIPATLDDNPHLDREAYIKSLANLDPLTRQQLLKGDWSARNAGNKFQREWFKIVDEAPVNCPWVRYWDMAGTEKTDKNDPDWTSGCLMGRTKEGQFYIKDMRHVRLSAQGTDKLTLQMAELDGRAVKIYFEQEPGESGKRAIDYHIRRMAGFIVHGDKKTGDKELMANPVSSQAEAGNIYLVRGPWINDFLDEAEAFPNGSHDDQVDAMSGAFAQLAMAKSHDIFIG